MASAVEFPPPPDADNAASFQGFAPDAMQNFGAYGDNQSAGFDPSVFPGGDPNAPQMGGTGQIPYDAPLDAIGGAPPALGPDPTEPLRDCQVHENFDPNAVDLSGYPQMEAAPPPPDGQRVEFDSPIAVPPLSTDPLAPSTAPSKAYQPMHQTIEGREDSIIREEATFTLSPHPAHHPSSPSHHHALSHPGAAHHGAHHHHRVVHPHHTTEVVHKDHGPGQHTHPAVHAASHKAGHGVTVSTASHHPHAHHRTHHADQYHRVSGWRAADQACAGRGASTAVDDRVDVLSDRTVPGQSAGGDAQRAQLGSGDVAVAFADRPPRRVGLTPSPRAINDDAISLHSDASSIESASKVRSGLGRVAVGEPRVRGPVVLGGGRLVRDNALLDGVSTIPRGARAAAVHSRIRRTAGSGTEVPIGGKLVNFYAGGVAAGDRADLRGMVDAVEDDDLFSDAASVRGSLTFRQRHEAIDSDVATGYVVRDRFLLPNGQEIPAPASYRSTVGMPVSRGTVLGEAHLDGGVGSIAATHPYHHHHLEYPHLFALSEDAHFAPPIPGIPKGAPRVVARNRHALRVTDGVCDPFEDDARFHHHTARRGALTHRPFTHAWAGHSLRADPVGALHLSRDRSAVVHSETHPSQMGHFPPAARVRRVMEEVVEPISPPDTARRVYRNPQAYLPRRRREATEITRVGVPHGIPICVDEAVRGSAHA